MYKPGDTVLYGVHGVCVIVDVTIQTVDRKKREFYVLHPYGQEKDRFYLPTDNAAALAKMHPLLPRGELESLLTECTDVSDIWISDDNQRKQRYREFISSGDRLVLVKMIRVLHLHKINQLACGRKFHLSDENYLRESLKLLSSEISYVLQITQREAIDYLTNKLCN